MSSIAPVTLHAPPVPTREITLDQAYQILGYRTTLFVFEAGPEPAALCLMPIPAPRNVRPQMPKGVPTCPVSQTSAVQSVAMSPEPTTSGYLRWMNIWLDADARNLIGAGKDVSIFGAGKWDEKGREYCPQLAEACKMFPGSRITIYDSNQNVLTMTQKMNHAQERVFIMQTFDNNSDQVSASNFERVKQQLSDPGVPVCTLASKRFRMGLDALADDATADVMIATFSLYYPMIECAKSDTTGEKRTELLAGFLAKLKPGGVLYIEKDCVRGIL